MAGCHNSLDGAIRRLSCFNPHPARWLDATRWSIWCRVYNVKVSTLTQPDGRMPPIKSGRWSISPRSFNPHPARWPDATGGAFGEAVFLHFVSTLTQPDGRMPRDRRIWVHQHIPVSTLTQPDGRMPRTPVHRLRTHRRCFSPHPARRLYATVRDHGISPRGPDV